MAAEQRPDPTAYEIIFSCSICQATILDIYGNNCGILGDDATTNSISTRLWLTECAHLTCGKHLEDGAFYPEGEQPSAPCPRCVADRRDGTPKKLFAVRGHEEGQIDKAIPRMWFDTPPTNLQKADHGLEAIRFQYLSLIQFGTGLLQSHRKLKSSHTKLKQTMSELDKAGLEITSELNKCKQRVALLSKQAEEYKRFKSKEPQIRHYLGVMAKMAKENGHLKKELISLGYEVPHTDYTYTARDIPTKAGLEERHASSGASPDSAIDMTEHDPISQCSKRRMEVAATIYDDEPLMSREPEGAPSTKRPKLEHDLSQPLQHGFQPFLVRDCVGSSSRDRMPPPKPPLCHQRNDEESGPRLGNTHSQTTTKLRGSDKEHNPCAHEIEKVQKSDMTPLPVPKGYYMSGALMSPPRHENQADTQRRNERKTRQNSRRGVCERPLERIPSEDPLPFVRPSWQVESGAPKNIEYGDERSWYQGDSYQGDVTSAVSRASFTFSKPPAWVGRNHTDSSNGAYSAQACEMPEQNISQHGSNGLDQHSVYETPSRYAALQQSPSPRYHRTVRDTCVSSPFFRRQAAAHYSMEPSRRDFAPRTREPYRDPQLISPSARVQDTHRLSFMQSPREHRVDLFSKPGVLGSRNEVQIHNPNFAALRQEQLDHRSGFMRQRPARLVAPLSNPVPSRATFQQSYGRRGIDPRTIINGSKMRSSQGVKNGRPSSMRPPQQQYFGNAAVRRSILR
ncbi:hypothetical protein EJ05DRAFT_302159 [Pseudovirgaria hyperparasitica]|uniref:Uncharacterized protein n=1 Tax=Pseudovirgaria hyperparasitica TaxID=470096 RepID=A0A6A6WC62_9PEZI|nr:uncharacterized protein EJ05DRAFT_302159 [Pseudovirgaria hyperparasitica]KAF2759550.1 hypothetical protein EJ05DRAFT_302159 [Pseudovirgaria hyperparasitica]